MTVLNKEMKENNRVELTIRVEKPEWQKALDLSLIRISEPTRPY